ncbi:hypothetical protein AOG23_33790 [Rhizobium acidisoli]|nr:hypothetical protein AOG23_33790 [Rhizobium acidisoli]
MEYAPDGLHCAKGRLMARSMHICTIEDVATMTGENLELLREIVSIRAGPRDFGRRALSPSAPTERRRMSLAKARPNFSAHGRIV